MQGLLLNRGTFSIAVTITEFGTNQQLRGFSKKIKVI